MWYNIRSQYDEEHDQEKWINLSAVKAFTVFPDGTVTLSIEGVGDKKVGPFGTDELLDDFVEKILENKNH